MPDLRPLGRTGVLVSPIGLGLAALGRPGYINLGHADDLEADYDVGRMEARTHEVLDAAWAAGVRYFDAARSYGRAEDFLGAWVEQRAIPPQALTIGSKWGYTYTAGWKTEADKHEVKDHSLATLERQIGETRARLGDHLDLYLIHSATLDSGALDRPDVHRRLAELRREDVQIGLSLSGPGQGATLERALEIRVDGEPVFSIVQATWNVLEPSAGPALAAAHSAGWGVVIKEAVANGRLTPRNRDPELAPLRRALAETGAALDAASIAAALAQPWVDVVLSGAAAVSHLHANLAALEVPPDALPLDELTTLAETPETYWKKRAALDWN